MNHQHLREPEDGVVFLHAVYRFTLGAAVAALFHLLWSYEVVQALLKGACRHPEGAAGDLDTQVEEVVKRQTLIPTLATLNRGAQLALKYVRYNTVVTLTKVLLPDLALLRY